MPKRTLTGLLALLLIAAGCGSGGINGSDTGTAATTGAHGAPPAPTTVKVGGKLTVDADGITAVWTVTATETRKTDQFGLTPQNGTFLLAHVQVDVREGQTFVCSCDLSVITTSGKVIDQGFASFKNRPDLNSTDVQAGQNVDGWVFFDLSAAQLKGARLQLRQQSLFSDADLGYWKL